MPTKETIDRQVLALTLLSMDDVYRQTILGVEHKDLPKNSTLKLVDAPVYSAFKTVLKTRKDAVDVVGQIPGEMLVQDQAYFAPCDEDYSGGSCPRIFVKVARQLLDS